MVEPNPGMIRLNSQVVCHNRPMIRKLTRQAGRLFLLVAALAIPATDAIAATVKVGFIGMRHGHAWRQLRDVSEIAEARFVGVAESIPGLIEEAKKVQPDAHYASDYREFVKQQKPEIVWAFVENNRHLEIAEFLAPLGIHVIFEKPLAASYRDAVRIRELAQEHGIKVMDELSDGLVAFEPRDAEAGI